MKALRILLTTVVVLGLIGGGAYAAGLVVRDHGPSATAAGGTPDRRAAPAEDPTDEQTDEQTGAQTGSPTPDDTPEPTPEVEPAAPADVLTPGDRGTQVRELQARLFQLAWLPETTTGRYDATTREAVSGFQAKRGFEATGVVDRRTWKRLVAMSEQPTHDQMFNVLHPGPALLSPSDSGTEVRDLQARLKSIQWYFGDVTGSYDDDTVEAVRGFQAKREVPVTGEVDQRTLDRLHGMTSTPTDAAMHNEVTGGNQPGALDARCRSGRVLCIDKTSQTLRWVVDGKVQMTFDVRFGASYSPTREGVFHVYWKDPDHVSDLYGSEMPYSMFFSGGQAVHYSSDFAARGYAGASHGCVNVRDHDGLAALFGQVRVGDDVVVYWS